MLPRLLLILALAFAGAVRAAEPLLILVSIDAFRWDFLEQYAAEAPHLRVLAAEGVRAGHLIPCFPSSTFPNHYSIATGLRPEHHGIIYNEFRDPVMKAVFMKSVGSIDGRWWGGEPIWCTAVKHGLRSACMFWPGSEAEIGGVRPTCYRPFDPGISAAARVDVLLGWLDAPTEMRPSFCTLYFDAVDRAGHAAGPDSREVGAAVRDVDSAIARLLAGLAARGFRETANLVIVSDHGLTAVGEGHVIPLDDLVDLKSVEVEFLGTQAGLRPHTGTAGELAAAIKKKAPAHVRVCLREEMPEPLHYRDNRRIPPVLLLADEGWLLSTREAMERRPQRERGTHGYDPALRDMGGVFIARGPAFRSGAMIPPAENIHIYNLLCRILGLKPAKNDGDDRLIRAALLPAPAR